MRRRMKNINRKRLVNPYCDILKNHRSLSHTRRTIDLKNCGDTGDDCGRTGKRVRSSIVSDRENIGVKQWRREKFFRYSRKLKDLIGIGNNFYARKLCLRIKLPFMREWVRKRHMTDFEMNVYRERAALAKKLYSMQTANPLAFGTSRRVSPRGSTGKGSACRKKS